MSGNSNSKPSPVIKVNENRDNTDRKQMIRMAPAAILSVLFHGVLLGLFMLLAPRGEAAPQTENDNNKELLAADQASDEKKDPLITTDIDPASLEPDTDINYINERKADVSVPGSNNANEAVGIKDGDKSALPMNLHAPGGFSGIGQGGAVEVSGPGNTMAAGELGGYNVRGMPLAGSFYGRSGATRENALRNGGGTTESEACVVRGLKWLIRQQSPDGKWMLDGAFKDKGSNNDTAGTAFGLLPLLAAGKTHKPAPDNPYDKPVEKALAFLIRRQNKKNGDLGGGMYSHGLASIALCEAYGLTQDPNLRRPAQMAINYIVFAQHEGGGWRYGPNQAGDTSVTGWQIMAIKSGQMAGLDVPEVTVRKAISYLNSCADSSEGYGYTGPGATRTMSAVGLLCRQYMQNWGPQNLRMIKGVDNHLKPSPPTTASKDIYFYYYATQVMHHFGGEAWKDWNVKMRESLVKTQESNQSSPNFGSWSSEGDAHGKSGGRLMITSMNLLTLEVYYRYLPLYYRDTGAKKDGAVGKAL